MADKKISQLPAATTPLAGTELLPVVQGGVTDQTSVANLTAGRAVSAAELTLSTGNLVIGTSGKGVDFSATANGSGTMTSELLTDYEEGTWTPVVADAVSGGNVATASVSGIYTKIGRTVLVQFSIASINTTGMTGTNGVVIRGLPYTIKSTNTAQGSLDLRNTVYVSYPQLAAINNNTYLTMYIHTSGAGVDTVLVSALTGSTFIFGTLSYQV